MIKLLAILCEVKLCARMNIFIYNGKSCENSERLSAVNYFCKKLHLLGFEYASRDYISFVSPQKTVERK